MVFSSLEFLVAYLPITLILYYLSPVKWRNAVLFLVSLVFYGWGEPVYVILMAVTILADYGFGYWIGSKKERGENAKSILVLSCIFNLGILFFFKYYNFIAGNLRPVLTFLPNLNVELPIGISFYTFQALSYVIDVYRGDAEKQKNPIDFGAYVTMFPQLIAGPIVKYREVADRLKSRTVTLDDAASGVRIFIVGLAKKVLLADMASELWLAAAESDSPTAAAAWLGILMRTAQIYFDFSGYSDMAIGLGRILGFEFLKNFNYPYISKSITEFWRRWHISLSTWFREYVYIPLGGNRRGLLIQYRNMLIVWLCTGLWHGDSWNFVLWGLFYFVLLALEKALGEARLTRIPAALRHLFTMTAVTLGWVLFSFDELTDVISYLGAMFGQNGAVSITDLYDITRSIPFLLILAVASTPLPKKIADRFAAKNEACRIFLDVTGILTMLLCVAYLISSAYHPFLYFRF